MDHETRISPVSFSAQEQHILTLYDRLQELELESKLLRAHGESSLGEGEGSPETLKRALQEAEEQLLHAKAASSLRNKVTETILIVDPILKAVHGGSNANPAERALLPLIQQRDELSIAHTNLSSGLTSTMSAMSEAATAHEQHSRRNAELTRTLLELAAQARTKVDEVEDDDLRTHLHELERTTKIQLARRRTMKSIVSAVVVESGLDWARDEHLRALVVDDEEELSANPTR
ncbi:MAG: hypothetical protein M1838_002348 [Thelocarpon superellum]|nr:MAG: hypothetical protein M1838_002348 [Thelocarpon superellum]